MEDKMQIVIEIPEYVYEHLKESVEDSHDESIAIDAIIHGTVLPKSHGDLVDADEDMSNYTAVWDCECSECEKQTVMAVDDLRYLPVVIPATKGD